MLATAHQWPILVELDALPQSDFVDVVWELTDRAVAGKPIGAGSLRNGLSCE